MFPRTHWGLNAPGRRKPVFSGKVKRAIAQAAQQAVSPLDVNNLCKKAQLDKAIRTRVQQKKNSKVPISKPIVSTSSSESDTLQLDTLEKDLFLSSSEEENPLVIDETVPLAIDTATDTDAAIVTTTVSTPIVASTTTTTPTALLSTVTTTATTAIPSIAITTPATTFVTATTTASSHAAIIVTAPLATATTTTAAVTASVSVPAIKAFPSQHRLSQQRIAEINRRARENQSASNFVLPPIARPPRRAISPTFARFNPGLVSPSPGYAPQVAFYGSNPPNIVINNYYPQPQPQPQPPYHQPPILPQFAPRYNDGQVELMTRGQFGRWCKRNSKEKIAEAVAKRAAFKQSQPHRNQPY